jgi:alpha-tubulin suppressor-like RCC1 family protein
MTKPRPGVARHAPLRIRTRFAAFIACAVAPTIVAVNAPAGDGPVVLGWGSRAFRGTRDGLVGVAEVSAGSAHSAVRRADGSFAVFGSNTLRQCDAPADLRRVRSIAAGRTVTAAIDDAGFCRVWGAAPVSPVVPPADLGAVTRIAVGGEHVLAITTAGVLRAFGVDDSGQTVVPSDVVNGALDISAGEDHSLAIRADGIVRCFGANNHGQSSVPNWIGSTTLAACGAFHSMARSSTGALVCWGLNSDGQTTVPPDLGAVIDVSGGIRHTAAVRTDGSVLVWGDNAFGQTNTPKGLAGVIALDCGDHHTVALRADGRVLSWGAETEWQCLEAPEYTPIRTVALGPRHAAITGADGTFTVFGGDNFYGELTPPAGLGSVQDVVCGESFTVAHRIDGTVSCWGDNTSQQCNVPVNLGAVVSVCAGRAHVATLNAAGVMRCWGDNSFGQSTVSPTLPTVASIVAWGDRTGYVLTDGRAGARGVGGNILYPNAAVGGWTRLRLSETTSMLLRSDGMQARVNAGLISAFDLPAECLPAIDIAAGTRRTVALRNDGRLFTYPLQTSNPGDQGERTAPVVLQGGTAVFGGGGAYAVVARGDAFVDCDANGLDDGGEIAANPALDANLDGVLDRCQPVTGDLTGDGLVGAADLTVLLSAWGTRGSPADLNGDGVVGSADITVLLSAWTM